jgi:hypothetical protein
MLYLIVKSAVSGVIVALASEVARCGPRWSCRYISILATIWLWRDTGDIERTAGLARRTFWLVLQTLPFFLVLPAAMPRMPFWPVLGTACLVAVVLCLLLPKLGASL